ncbi:MAG: DEAD/DEAH box helicase [SAR324 cluster bacterium]|nr:DEAD/DEAH box helicase [SAR324 cluster bacterium]
MSNSISFSDLSLPVPILSTLKKLGYAAPTPIQEQTIPHLMQGKDVLAQAQTGTGKTGAFALPLLARLDLKRKLPQVLVLAPTRELAIQVSESFQCYAKQLKGFRVLPIYGGQGYSEQLQGLKHGVHVVVGTPGRLLDHLKRGSLVLDELRAIVLDEADEMLRMGFIEDVKDIIFQAPENCQMTMFSATMPHPIKKIASQYLKNPSEIKIVSKTTTVESVKQSYLILNNNLKMETLTRLLEIDDYDGVLVFARTKAATVKISEKLAAKGFSVSALNGDMSQTLREKTITHLKERKLDIVVATDVAARGLDVERISLVINFDIPQDTEPYVHRIGRTGRAGREGKAISFITPQEKRMLRTIEQATRQTIELAKIPSNRDLEKKRMQLFKERIAQTLSNSQTHALRDSLDELTQTLDVSADELSLALLYMVQKNQPLKVKSPLKEAQPSPKAVVTKKQPRKSTKQKKANSHKPNANIKFDRYRLEVGRKHKVKVADIVRVITHAADIENQHIGHIQLYSHYSTVELPEGMPKTTFHHLKKTNVRKRQLDLSLM